MYIYILYHASILIVYFLMFVGTLKPAFEMLQYSAPRSWARLAKRGGHPLWHGPKGPKMGCKEQATHPMMSPLGGLVVHFLTCFIPPNLMDYILSWSPLLCGHLEGYFLLCIDMPPLKVESHIYPQFYPYYVYRMVPNNIFDVAFAWFEKKVDDFEDALTRLRPLFNEDHGFVWRMWWLITIIWWLITIVKMGISMYIIIW